mgnify:CR=1 FL=1
MTAGGRLRGRQVLGGVLSLALVLGVFAWFLPQFTSLADVWTSVRDMTWLELTVLLLAAAWNLATYQFVMVSTTPGLRLRQALVSTQTTTAVSNTVVGGAAIALGLTYAMNSSWGFSRSRTSVALLVSGLWNNFAKLALPVLALALLALSAPPSAGRLTAGLLGLAYSLGLGIPFLILAAGWGWASRSVTFLRRHIRALNIIGGAMLIALGLLMVTGLWTVLMSQLQQVVINVPLPL